MLNKLKQLNFEFDSAMIALRRKRKLSLRDEKNTQSVIINAVDRTIDIIEYIYKSGGGVSISKISKDLDLYKSTVYRTLVTLETRGYIVQDEKSELYSLGHKFFLIGKGADQNKELSSLLMPYMKRLNDRYGESVNLGKIEKGTDGIYRLVIISECESKHSLSAKIDIGAMHECYCASLGKCLLAFSKGIDISVYKGRELKRFTDTTITTFEGLKKELERIRRDGFSLDAEEREKGLFCIGVPIMKDGYSIAAMSLSGPTGRIKDDNYEEKIEYMKALSKEIERDVFI